MSAAATPTRRFTTDREVVVSLEGISKRYGPILSLIHI